MKKLLILLSFILFQPAYSQEKDIFRLENPVNSAWLKATLSRQSPKLILTPSIEKELRAKLKSDKLAANYFSFIKAEADKILGKPFLKRELEGFRLLAVSREMVERMTTLCMVYRIEKNPGILKRIDEELRTVCLFTDWNPQHYLDVAEMSFAVALAVDWAGNALPKETVRLAKESLITKGILPSFDESGPRMGWINGTNNWNAVCHGGMIAAALMTADINPDLAAKTISRALDKLPNSLKEYAPDGIYPEGPTYWSYGTSYTVLAANMLTTALGSDFGISRSPGFMKSVDFLLHVTAPSGFFFNFADSGDEKGGDQSVLMSWFASKTGDGLYFDRTFFEKPAKAGRLGSLALVWMTQFSQEKVSTLPLNWHGEGKNPVAVLRGPKGDPGQFYLAAKGGQAQISHGNMDAGSFIFDLDGIRWVLDPGNQNYYQLNRIGFNLSGLCQDCPRWTLLTKSNLGHSTVVVNDERFLVNRNARITEFTDGNNPQFTIEMTPLYGNSLSSLKRKFIKENNRSFLIEDIFRASDSTRLITWALITAADVSPSPDGAVLEMNGKKLKMTILSPSGINVSVISLEPPPLKIDKTIKDLKRIEIRIPAWTAENGEGIIRVRLSGEN